MNFKCGNCGARPDARDQKRIKDDLAKQTVKPIGWTCEACAPDLALAPSGLAFGVVDVVGSSPRYEGDRRVNKNEAQALLKLVDIPIGYYVHYKDPSDDNQYIVFAVTIDEATLSPLVHYYSCKHGTRWTRTAKNFIEAVKVEGLSEPVPRFRFKHTVLSGNLMKAAGI